MGGRYRFFAGWRSDPFFFDAGAVDNFKFTGTDLFGDKDVCSVALEVPNAALGAKEVRLWARTVVRADDARFVPVFAHSQEHTGGFARTAWRFVIDNPWGTD